MAALIADIYTEPCGILLLACKVPATKQHSSTCSKEDGQNFFERHDQRLKIMQHKVERVVRMRHPQQQQARQQGRESRVGAEGLVVAQLFTAGVRQTKMI